MEASSSSVDPNTPIMHRGIDVITCLDMHVHDYITYGVNSALYMIIGGVSLPTCLQLLPQYYILKKINIPH